MIPDSVLREWVANAERNPTMDSERYPNRADIARVLLESREALRCVMRDHGTSLGVAALRAVRRCLPESAP